MKKFSVRVLALILAVVLCFSMTACSADVSTVLLMRKAYKTLTELESFSFTAEAAVNGEAAKLPLKLNVKADSRCITEPMVVQSQVTADMGRLGTVNAPVYLSRNGDSVNLSIGLERDGSTIWYSTDIALPEAEAEEEHSIDLEKIITMAEEDPDMISIGEPELIDGRSAIPFNISLPMTFIMELIGEAGIDAGQERQLISIWLDEESLLPMRMKLDMTKLASILAEQASYDSLPRLAVNELLLSIDITGFNDVEGISLPAA